MKVVHAQGYATLAEADDYLVYITKRRLSFYLRRATHSGAKPSSSTKDEYRSRELTIML